MSLTWSWRWLGNEAIATRVIYSESEKAGASSASMLGMPMNILHQVSHVSVTVALPDMEQV